MTDLTPRPEPVTLTDEEREALICDCAAGQPSACVVHGAGYIFALHHPDDLVARVERILAAREQALREKHERIVADLKSCWKVDMRDARERGEALARVEALAGKWERDWDDAVDRGRADTGFAARKGAARRIRAALRGEPR